MVLSWAGEELCGLGWGHVNCLKEPLQTYVEARTDFVFDAEMTARLRNSSEISWIQKSVSFFRKPPHAKTYNYDPAFGEVAAQQYYARLERIKQQQKEASTTTSSALVDRKKQPSKHHAERGKYVQMILNAPVLRVPEQRKHTVVMTSPESTPQLSSGGSASPGFSGRSPEATNPQLIDLKNLAKHIGGEQPPAQAAVASSSSPGVRGQSHLVGEEKEQGFAFAAPQQQQLQQHNYNKPQDAPSTGDGTIPAPAFDEHGRPVLGGFVQQKITNTISDSKAAIQRGIYELDKINELHKSRRPKGEPAPDLLNYKEVFKALERDYGGEKLDQRIGVHE